VKPGLWFGIGWRAYCLNRLYVRAQGQKECIDWKCEPYEREKRCFPHLQMSPHMIALALFAFLSHNGGWAPAACGSRDCRW
jgi:hypothetical protein